MTATSELDARRHAIRETVRSWCAQLRHWPGALLLGEGDVTEPLREDVRVSRVNGHALLTVARNVCQSEETTLWEAVVDALRGRRRPCLVMVVVHAGFLRAAAPATRAAAALHWRELLGDIVDVAGRRPQVRVLVTGCDDIPGYTRWMATGVAAAGHVAVAPASMHALATVLQERSCADVVCPVSRLHRAPDVTACGDIYRFPRTWSAMAQVLAASITQMFPGEGRARRLWPASIHFDVAARPALSLNDALDAARGLRRRVSRMWRRRLIAGSLVLIGVAGLAFGCVRFHQGSRALDSMTGRVVSAEATLADADKGPWRHLDALRALASTDTDTDAQDARVSDLRGTAAERYHDAIAGRLLPAVAGRIHAVLSSPATQAPDRLHAALRAYLALHAAGPDMTALSPWLTEAAAHRHLEGFTHPPDSRVDMQLVTAARAQLGRTSPVERIYRRAVTEIMPARGRTISIASMTRGAAAGLLRRRSGVSLHAVLPLWASASGHREFVARVSTATQQALEDEAWVMGARLPLETTREAVLDLHHRENIAVWQAALSDLRVVNATSPSALARRLNLLAGEDSPLASLIHGVAVETSGVNDDDPLAWRFRAMRSADGPAPHAWGRVLRADLAALALQLDVVAAAPDAITPAGYDPGAVDRLAATVAQGPGVFSHLFDDVLPAARAMMRKRGEAPPPATSSAGT
ncbi:type VI protein secretion system component VasK [Luteibacter sp. Sphag1AF]|uniref:ImcF-related family protein n=1 Tax=Luteibacter sp. Sphag1AF TaxID=2587031 RepID=UPI0016197C9F|nr:ImcF-related family protein [Luteibacter sp. Sphag1AF]MBB3226946.1 type VI protein secretion system component VasK [Luteibacter sp. Sphag1AF]